jgi:hypothetical protein
MYQEGSQEKTRHGSRGYLAPGQATVDMDQGHLVPMFPSCTPVLASGEPLSAVRIRTTLHRVLLAERTTRSDMETVLFQKSIPIGWKRCIFHVALSTSRNHQGAMSPVCTYVSNLETSEICSRPGTRGGRLSRKIYMLGTCLPVG